MDHQCQVYQCQQQLAIRNGIVRPILSLLYRHYQQSMVAKADKLASKPRPIQKRLESSDNLDGSENTHETSSMTSHEDSDFEEEESESERCAKQVALESGLWQTGVCVSRVACRTPHMR